MDRKETQLQKQETQDVKTVERTRWGKVFAPAIDIIETPYVLKLYADMPGVDGDSIEIMVDQGVLTIQGHIDVTPVEGYELEYQEYDIGDFQRTFTLTDTVDQDNIEANYNNGVLELVIPKTEKAKPKKITVKSN
jgi:HSP20 family molecular chaperone IbpA